MPFIENPPASDQAKDGRDTTPPWWQGAIIYQIYPRSFLDTNGDGVGDLPGIIQKLDYIASLGVEAIWISPFYTSPMDDFGYDVSDFINVDPVFGTLADFDKLVAHAHDLSIRVIIDQIYSHTSEQHAWFEESRQNQKNSKANWYVWRDAKPDGSPPTNWQSVFGGPAWQWDARRKQYYLHNFLTSQPDLNVHNPDVQNALLETARFWLDRGVDGFRLDAINFAMHDPDFRDNPPSGTKTEQVTRPFDMQKHIYNQSHPDIVVFLERLVALLTQYGVKFSVAEVTGTEPFSEMQAFTKGPDRLSSAYNFDFLYLPELTTKAVLEAVSPWDDQKVTGWPSWAFSNHDAPRAVSRWSCDNNDESFARLYLMLLLSFRGNAFIYQGEELALQQGIIPYEHLQDPEAIENWPHTLGRDGARTPVPWITQSENAGFTTGTPWLSINERQYERATDRQEENTASMLHFTRKAISIRKQSAALRYGSQSIHEYVEGALQITRISVTHKVTCLFNLADSPKPLPADFPAQNTVILTNTKETNTLPEALPAFSGYWLKR
jgi:alpha-glucosidase